jgi:hypothetical protein
MQFDISDDDIGSLHRNSRYAGTTQQWSGSDNAALFEKNTKDPDRYQLLKFHGWLDPDVITYKYNRYGFRCDEFDDRPAIMALGCSHTEGVGVREQDTWSIVLSKLLGVHVWNLGVGSSSVDTVFRLLDYWLPKLTPKCVVICLPASGRVELFQHNWDGPGQTPIAVGPWSNGTKHVENFYKSWLSSPFNQIFLKRKNLLAIQQLCDKANTSLVIEEADVIINANMHSARSSARDLMHPSAKNHAYFAQHMYNALPMEIKK